MLAVSNSRLQLSSKAVLDAITFYNRVIADGGTVSDFSLVQAEILELKRQCVYQDISLLTTASGRKAGKQYSILPTDGSGDLSVTRSGDTAMELNANGFWQPVAANLPRYDYVGGRPMLNVEELRTNLLPRYKSFAHSDWTKSGARIEGDPTTAGAELVINGGFNTDTGWIKESGITIVDGVLRFTSTTSSNKATASTISVVAGRVYMVTYTMLNRVAGTLRVEVGSANYVREVTANGTYTDYIYCTSSGTLNIRCINTSTFDVDNVSVKEVTGYASPFVDSAGANLMDGYKLVATANNGYIRLATATTVTEATTYTNSIWIKRATGTGEAYIIDTNTTDRAITLTTQWQRFTYSAAAGSTSGQIGVKLAVAGDEVLIAHAQLEAGATASSPIGGAEGSAQSRNADVIVKTGASALIGQTEGYAVVEVNVSKLLGTVDRGILYLSEGAGADNRIRIAFSTGLTNTLSFRISSGSTLVTVFNHAISSIGIYKIGIAWKNNDSAMCINGQLITADSNGAFSFSATLQQITLGALQSGLSQLNDRIKLVDIGKTRISNEKLIELTTL